MKKYIDKDALVAEIDRRINELNPDNIEDWRYRLQREHDIELLKSILSFLNILEVKDPYEQTVQYDSIKAGIQAHAETYSFNIESELFNQLTLEQQKLWRKEIEQAVISGGEAGIELVRDTRYKENLEVKGMDLDKELNKYFITNNLIAADIQFEPVTQMEKCAKHFFELGLKASSPLTWEDMMTIHKCCKDAMNCNLYAWETAEGQQKIYEDVLKRFKDLRHT